MGGDNLRDSWVVPLSASTVRMLGNADQGGELQVLTRELHEFDATLILAAAGR